MKHGAKLNRDYQRNLYVIRGFNQKTEERVRVEIEATPDELPGRLNRLKQDCPQCIFNQPQFIKRL